MSFYLTPSPKHVSAGFYFKCFGINATSQCGGYNWTLKVVVNQNKKGYKHKLRPAVQDFYI